MGHSRVFESVPCPHAVNTHRKPRPSQWPAGHLVGASSRPLLPAGHESRLACRGGRECSTGPWPRGEVSEWLKEPHSKFDRWLFFARNYHCGNNLQISIQSFCQRFCQEFTGLVIARSGRLGTCVQRVRRRPQRHARVGSPSITISSPPVGIVQAFTRAADRASCYATSQSRPTSRPSRSRSSRPLSARYRRRSSATLATG